MADLSIPTGRIDLSTQTDPEEFTEAIFPGPLDPHVKARDLSSKPFLLIFLCENKGMFPEGRLEDSPFIHSFLRKDLGPSITLSDLL